MQKLDDAEVPCEQIGAEGKEEPRAGNNEYVLQPWVAGVGLKMQSILISGFRAPDQRSPSVKQCVRWLRAQCQLDADPAKQSYMQTVEMTFELVNQAMDELGYLTVHYVHHFANAFAVVAYHHPDKAVRRWAYHVHRLVAGELFHFVPETMKQFLGRHKDKRTK